MKNNVIKWCAQTFDELSNKELFSIYKLRTAVFVVEQNCPYQEVDDKDLQAIHFSGYLGEDLVAYCRILPAGVSYPEISIGRVVVAPEYRKSGVGRELMAQALAYIENSMNTAIVRISAQTYLKQFYESLGFVQQKEEYLEDGIPHIEMLRLSKN